MKKQFIRLVRDGKTIHVVNLEQIKIISRHVDGEGGKIYFDAGFTIGLCQETWESFETHLMSHGWL